MIKPLTRALATIALLACVLPARADQSPREFLLTQAHLTMHLPQSHLAKPLYQARQHRPVRHTPARSGMIDLIAKAARRHGVPVQFALGVAHVESGFNPRARSWAAIGIMQVRPQTAREVGCSGTRAALSNPAIGAECGMRYLAAIYRDQHGNRYRTAAYYTQGRYAHHVSRAGAHYARIVLASANLY